MAKLVTAPPKFTHPEWTISNQIKYANAESERAAAERLIAESIRLDEETATTTIKTRRDVNKKLGLCFFKGSFVNTILFDISLHGANLH